MHFYRLPSGRAIRVTAQLHHHLDRARSHLLTIDADRRQRRSDERAEGDVVDADHRDVVGDTAANVLQLAHRADGHDVVVREHAIEVGEALDQLAIIALFGMIQQIGTQIPWFGLDSHWSLIAIYVSFGMGINVLLVKRYIDRLPRELDDSALVDGATHGKVFRAIVFPLILPIIVTVSVLQFFAIYGDFIIARVLLRSNDNLTVMVGLLLFQTQRFEQDWGIITAGAVLASLPVVLLYIPVQKYVISGLTSGAVKG